MTTTEDHLSSRCGSTHRFLSLPVARPCTDAVSGASLLRALLAVANEIADRRPLSSKTDDLAQRFPVHSCRRGAHKAVHVARLVHAFLEELQYGGQQDHLLLPALSELYVAFQKLRALLHDCTIRGARILMLMNAHRIAREFRSFHESMATAVDSLLMLPSIDTTAAIADSELAELAELAARQARRAAKDVASADPADNKAAHDVRAILATFERGVSPKKVAIRRIMDYLHIRTWADSDAEVAFLECQLAHAATDAQSSASSFDLLQGLRGLMLYARGVLFDATESTSGVPAGGSNRGGCGSTSTAAEFAWLDLKGLRCPISLDLMTDPVTVATGQTYNRASIVRWLRAGNLTCPVTGKHLRGASEDHHLLPNIAVRNVIHQFCQARRLKIPEQTELGRKNKRKTPAGCSTNNKAATAAMRLAVAHLIQQLSKGSSDARLGAVREVRLLARSGAPGRAALIEAGAAPWLLHLLASRDNRIRDDAAAAVMNLCKHPEGRRDIFEAGGLLCLVDLLDDGAGTSPDSQANAAGTLFYLASSEEEYRLVIGASPDIVRGLVDLLNTGTQRGKKNALTAILSLLASPANHTPVIAVGAVPTMIGLLASETDDILVDVVAAVAAMVETPQGARAVLAEPSRVRCLVEVLRSSAPTVAKECCISALTALCKNGGPETVGYLNRIPTLMPSLYSLLTESSPTASRKSSSLIRIIHRGHGEANSLLRFPPSPAPHSPASAPQLTQPGTHVHVR